MHFHIQNNITNSHKTKHIHKHSDRIRLKKQAHTLGNNRFKNYNIKLHFIFFSQLFMRSIVLEIK